MSPGWLFGIGVFVTLIVAIGVGLPVYGAILDGRDQAKRELARTDVLELSSKRTGPRPAA